MHAGRCDEIFTFLKNGIECMGGGDLYQESPISKNRLEALIDAIFAFAMTLLVLGFTVPAIPQAEAASTLPPLLVAMAPQFFIFLIAFLILANFWLAHHRGFYYVRTVDPAILWLNLFMLLFVVLVPFTTDIGGDYTAVPVAVFLFHANMFALGMIFWAHWRYLSYHPAVCSGAIPEQKSRCGSEKILVIPAAATLGMILSFPVPDWSMAVYILIPVAMKGVARLRKCR
jgi:uncharacterized membrane protein